jgi:hypothetical protein
LRKNFDFITENITETENTIPFDGFNNISTNNLAVILAQCEDKVDKDV